MATTTHRSAKRLKTLDEFLVELGKHAAFQAAAIKEVRAWQIENNAKNRQ